MVDVARTEARTRCPSRRRGARCGRDNGGEARFIDLCGLRSTSGAFCCPQRVFTEGVPPMTYENLADHWLGRSLRQSIDIY